MASLAGPISTALACVHCARSKARCDRKMPCTRCVRKKITCQSRMSRRKAARPVAMAIAIENAGLPAGRPISSSGDRTEESTNICNNNSGNGIWMDWSRRFDVRPTAPSAAAAEARRSRSKDLAKTQQDAFLSQLVSESTAADIVYPSHGLSADLVDFSAVCDDTAFAISPSALMDFSDAMQDYVVEVLPEEQLSPAVAHPPSRLPPPAQTDVPSFDHIDALDGWPLFRCNSVSSSSSCQQSRVCHVMNLYSLIKDSSSSSSFSSTTNHPPIETLLASTREKVTAVLQGLFYETQQLYGLCSQDHHQDGWIGPSVLTLPPPAEMELLLRAYADCCEPYYPVVPLAAADFNRAIEAGQTTLPSMTLLLTAAVGAMMAAVEPHQHIARGIVDICRTSLGRLIEQNVHLVAHPDVSRCAWLLIVATVWSGDKWHMDVGLYQKAMYLEMHLRAGRHEQQEERLAQINSSTDAVQRWELWKSQERLNRATYAWLILDYEICLFQDVPSTSYLSVINLGVPIPFPDAALTAPSAEHWLKDALSTGRDASTTPLSLPDFVGCFTDDISSLTHVSPTTLRILLCTLIDQILHLRARIDGLSARSQNHKSDRHTSAVLLSVQVHETQELLQKWFDLAQTWCPADSAANCANRIIYHLGVLNTMVSFPAVEKIARAGPGSVPALDLGLCGSSCRPGRAYHLDPDDTREIYVHCGQALRNICLLLKQARPPWWAGAVYRVALIAWANSLATSKADAAVDAVSMPDLQPLRLNVLSLQDSAIEAYLNHQPGGKPVFSDVTNGAAVSLADPLGVLLHCVRLLNSDVKTQLTHGIQQKLATMARRWGVVSDEN